MNKAFVKENDDSEELEAEVVSSPLPVGSKNYITPAGHARLMEEYQWLLNKERPDVTAIVSWAAGNGDRSENGDYIYGKRRLREIDKRLRFLSKRLEIAEIIDPTLPREDSMRIFFGATVCYLDQTGVERTVSIVGIDEIDPFKGYISWISPVARALISAQEGDTVYLRTPTSVEKLEILSVIYQSIAIPAFQPI